MAQDLQEQPGLIAAASTAAYEVALDSHKCKVYMTIAAEGMSLRFETRTDERQLLRAMVSFLLKDGEVVCRSSEQMRVGTFGVCRVELIHDDEYPDEIALLIGGRLISMRQYLDKGELVEACRLLLEELF